MAVHGNLGVFDRDLEDWASYCERVEQYFIANGISNADRKRAILLSVCGPATFKLMPSLQTNRSSRSSKQLVTIYVPSPPAFFSVSISILVFRKSQNQLRNLLQNFDVSQLTASLKVP